MKPSESVKLEGDVFIVEKINRVHALLARRRNRADLRTVWVADFKYNIRTKEWEEKP